MPSNKSPSKRLFVGSLPFRLPSAQLLEIFSPFGKIADWQIIFDKWGKSRGMAYIEYQELSSAIKAKESLHGSYLEDRTIIVDFAQPDPFMTPEGRQRHQEALKRRPPRQKFSTKSPRSRDFQKKSPDSGLRVIVLPAEEKGFSHPKYKSKYAGKKGHLRSSVFKQRYFGSRQGKKFASKTKTANKKS